MAYTYSTPESRARSAPAARKTRVSLTELVLLACAAVLVVAAVTIVSSAKGRATADAGPRQAAGQLLDLNGATKAEAIAPFLRVFTGDRERQFVAREILDHLSGGGPGPTARRTLPNVGALSRLTVETRRVQATAGLTVLQARLRELRERNGGTAPDRMTLLTTAQVATLKPSLAVRQAEVFHRAVRWHVVLIVVAFLLVYNVRRFRGVSGDPVLLPALLVLSGLGFALMVSLRDPLRDMMLFVPFAQGVGVGCVLLLAVTFVDLERSVLPRLSYVPLVAGLLLSALLVTLGTGPAGSDARVNLFGVQPVDAIRLLVTLFLAGYFAQRWELLRELQDPAASSWRRALRPPRRQDLVPLVGGIGLVLIAFFLQKDLGPALVVACVFLALYGVARGKWLAALGGLGMLVAGFIAGYVLRISSTLVSRIQIWQSPWDNGARGGDQVAQALWAVASGGWTGAGLGRGMPQVVPAAHTDLVLAAAGEELGFLGVLAIALLFAVIGARGLGIARRASGEYSSLLAVGLTVGLILPVLVIAGGLLGIVPLTGIVTPFLSYGRSALLASFVAVGLLLSISDRSDAAIGPSPFASGTRHVGYAGAVLALVLVAAAARSQVCAGDETITAGALTRQADGERRFSYNPRLLAAAEQIVRGTIFDRSGLPLATSRPDALAADASKLAALGLHLPPECADPERRCYPFGGPLFHLLGNVETQVNWAAPNTSFAERDRDARLRGYDDQARAVDVIDPEDGSRSRALRRNLTALLPLWKHREDPEHPEVRALLDQPRDVRLTIDARLQLKVASLLRARVTAARQQRGAAVVVDAVSGELLAAASYPWPEDDRQGSGARDGDEAAAERLLDRARYGVYPPGSTFKLVTASAVLRSAPALAGTPFTCRRLEDGRVGNTVPGWRRPVRDDIADTNPHGSVTLDRGVVHSCNAYFAQLGARLGGTALRETASAFDISLTRGNAPERLRDTLPFAAYGQGEVVATPYRMARVAAAIAADGVLAPARSFLDVESSTDTSGTRVLDSAAARRLADAMRQVVVAGTGRGLLAHPEQVAGKTGTAEVDDAPSHSWFVGFAPYGTESSRRIAFAVIIEHGGYGGRAAAPLAGGIVSAARELGLLGDKP